MLLPKHLSKVFVGLFAVAVLVWPKPSFADRGDRHDRGWRHHRHHHNYHHGWHHSYHRYYHRPHFGFHVSNIPYGSFSVSLGGGRRYHYYDGVYYSRRGPTYVVVPPPSGAVVNVIPSDYQPVVVNGVTYYTNNGVYYQYTRNGYQVVPQPVQVIESPAVVSAAAPQVVSAAGGDAPDSFTVNVPDDKGGYISIVVKRSGSGFTGPQGEYYSEFPKVAQLKAMYGE
jgi:hypothetical protein